MKIQLFFPYASTDELHTNCFPEDLFLFLLLHVSFMSVDISCFSICRRKRHHLRCSLSREHLLQVRKHGTPFCLLGLLLGQVCFQTNCVECKIWIRHFFFQKAAWQWKMMLGVSDRIVTKFQLTKLGVQLKLEDYEIRGILHDHPPTAEAVFELLTLWRNRAQNGQEAFKALEKALTKINELRILREVLWCERKSTGDAFGNWVKELKKIPSSMTRSNFWEENLPVGQSPLSC